MTSEPESASDDEIIREELDLQDKSKVGSGATAPPEGSGVIDRMVSGAVAHWLSILLTASMVAAVSLVAYLYVSQYRPDRQIDDAAAQRAVRAASDGAVAALSYSSENMDHDFQQARSHLTGDFLAYYDKFTKDFVIPTVQQKHLSQTATVVRAAVSELGQNSAVVLVFLNETTLGKDKPQPLMTPSSVKITLTKVGGSWLISKLDPVV